MKIEPWGTVARRSGETFGEPLPQPTNATLASPGKPGLGLTVDRTQVERDTVS